MASGDIVLEVSGLSVTDDVAGKLETSGGVAIIKQTTTLGGAPVQASTPAPVSPPNGTITYGGPFVLPVELRQALTTGRETLFDAAKQYKITVTEV